MAAPKDGAMNSEEKYMSPAAASSYCRDTSELDDEQRRLAEEVRGLLRERIRAAGPAASWCRDGRVVFWGVCLASLDEDETAHGLCGDALLFKFLQSRDMNSAAACEMIVTSAAWRLSFGADALNGADAREEDKRYAAYFDTSDFILVKNIGTSNLDRGGRPIVVHRFGVFNDTDVWTHAFNYTTTTTTGDAHSTGNAHAAGADAEERVEDVHDVSDAYTIYPGGERFIRWRIALMEKCVDLMDLESMERSSVSFVHDLRGLPYALVFQRAARATVARLISLLNDNYPEMAAKHIIVFGPYFLQLILTLLQPFISPQTKEKFAIIPSNGFTADALIDELGDGLSPEYLEDVRAFEKKNGAGDATSWWWPW